MRCTVCEEGFVNLHQIPEADFTALMESDDPSTAILKWIADNDEHDVAVCHCCGDGDADWYGEPGVHNASDYGMDGPYAYNGGLPLCY